MKTPAKIILTVILVSAAIIGFVALRKKPSAGSASSQVTKPGNTGLAVAATARCYVCDRQAPVETRVLVRRSQLEPLILCAPHCFFVYFSSLPERKEVLDCTLVTDGVGRNFVPLKSAFFVEEANLKKKLIIPAFADRDNAWKAQQKYGGRIEGWNVMLDQEMAHRCDLCQRAVYREDAGVLSRGEIRRFGCCALCTLGLAAQTQLPVVAEIKDACDGQRVKIKIERGQLIAAEPKTAMAWAGEKKSPSDSLPLSGDFKQAWFVNEANLRNWIQEHPTVTGKPIALSEAVAAAMILTKEQIIQTCNSH
jgi:hypothetical protein